MSDEDVSAEAMARLMVGAKRKAEDTMARAAKRTKRDRRREEDAPPAAAAAAPAAPAAPLSLEERLYGGEPPSLQFKLLEERKIWLSMKDLQGLILWLVGKDDSQMPPRWVFVRHKPLIKHCVVVCLNSMSLPMWSRHGKDAMPWLAGQAAEAAGDAGSSPTTKRFDTFHTRLNTSTADVKANSFLAEFFQKDVPKKRPQGGGAPFQQRQLTGVGAALGAFKQQTQQGEAPATPSGQRSAAGTPSGRDGGASPHPPPAADEVTVPDVSIDTAVAVLDKMRATQVELAEHGFCVSIEEVDGWLQTEPASRELAPHERVVCVDCEMCLTSAGHELARVTLLDWSGAVLYDQLVLPDNPIENYLTEYSGITAATLANVDIRLRDVRAKLLAEYIFADVTLIGHSLENDLKALKIVHLNVCDTTILYPHHQGPPLKRALRHITHRFLRRVIQDPSRRNGHCPVEDAKAALDLVKMKVFHGEKFGVPPKQRFEPVMRHVDGPCLVYDEPDLIPYIPARDSKADIVPVATDKEAFKKARRQVGAGRYPFVFLHLHSLEQYLDATEWGGFAEEDAVDATQEALLKDILRSTDEGLKTVYDAAPANTAFFVMSGQINGVPGQDDEAENAPEAHLRKWDTARHGMLWLGLKTKDAAALP